MNFMRGLRKRTGISAGLTDFITYSLDFFQKPHFSLQNEKNMAGFENKLNNILHQRK